MGAPIRPGPHIEYGSAFYDYCLVALGYVQVLGVFDPQRPAPMPISIAAPGA
jgi:hypothetical protein